MSDSEPSISEENAVLRAELQQQGQPITHAQAFLEAWKQAPNLTITEFNQLVSDPTGQTEQKKKDAEYTAAAVAQREVELKQQTAEINRRIDAGNFLKGENWDVDLKLIQAFGKNIFDKFDKDPSSLSQNERTAFTKASMTLEHECKQDPARMQEALDNPTSRKIIIYSISFRQQLIAGGHEFDPNLSNEQQLQQVEALIRNNPKIMQELQDKAICNANDSQSCCVNKEDKIRFAKDFIKLDQVINNKYLNELKGLSNIKDPVEHELALKNLQYKAAGEMGKEGEFIINKMEGFRKSPELMAKFDALYKEVASSLNGKEVKVVGKLGNQDRKDALDEFKATGKLSDETFAKVAEAILPDLEKKGHKMSLEDLKARCAADPKFKKMITEEIIIPGILVFDSQHQHIPIGGIGAKPAADALITKIDERGDVTTITTIGHPTLPLPAGLEDKTPSTKTPPAEWSPEIIEAANAIKAQQPIPAAPAPNSPPAQTNPTQVPVVAQNNTEATHPR